MPMTAFANIVIVDVIINFPPAAIECCTSLPGAKEVPSEGQ